MAFNIRFCYHSRVMCYHSILLDCWLLPVGPTFKHAWAAAFFPGAHANMSVSRTAARSPLKYLTARSRLCRLGTNMPLQHANMSVSKTAARSPLNTWQPDHVYAGLEQTCHLNMPTWAGTEQLHAPRWIPDSQIMAMQVWNKRRTAARSPLNTLQPSHVHAGFD